MLVGVVTAVCPEEIHCAGFGDGHSTAAIAIGAAIGTIASRDAAEFDFTDLHFGVARRIHDRHLLLEQIGDFDAVIHGDVDLGRAEIAAFRDLNRAERQVFTLLRNTRVQLRPLARRVLAHGQLVRTEFNRPGIRDVGHTADVCAQRNRTRTGNAHGARAQGVRMGRRQRAALNAQTIDVALIAGQREIAGADLGQLNALGRLRDSRSPQCGQLSRLRRHFTLDPRFDASHRFHETAAERVVLIGRTQRHLRRPGDDIPRA
ncbi:hypothetical protein PTE31013_03612 [Pandoraea terrigena]|uniref:Uncharacterized protein n=1 Tax=Pandoraea terrigena TaxID=2508292 RepID=A0A5E4X0U3_9BURK|nr:hypothetical protein PTE31013_03612 [Pandoraea terrigena]